MAEQKSQPAAVVAVMQQIIELIADASINEPQDFTWAEGNPADYEYEIHARGLEEKCFVVWRRTMEVLGGRHDGAEFKYGYELDLGCFSHKLKTWLGEDHPVDLAFVETEDAITCTYLAIDFDYAGIGFNVLLVREEDTPEAYDA